MSIGKYDRLLSGKALTAVFKINSKLTLTLNLFWTKMSVLLQCVDTNLKNFSF